MNTETQKHKENYIKINPLWLRDSVLDFPFWC
jgi:hypothetical protein